MEVMEMKWKSNLCIQYVLDASVSQCPRAYHDVKLQRRRLRMTTMLACSKMTLACSKMTMRTKKMRMKRYLKIVHEPLLIWVAEVDMRWGGVCGFGACSPLTATWHLPWYTAPGCCEPEGINLTQDTPPALDNFMAHQVHLTKLGIKLGFYQLSILVMFKSLGRACLTLCAEQTVGWWRNQFSSHAQRLLNIANERYWYWSQVLVWHLPRFADSNTRWQCMAHRAKKATIFTCRTAPTCLDVLVPS